MANFGKSAEFRYEVIRTIGEIPGERKWKIRLNLISWNGGGTEIRYPPVE